ncbi:hypothetical protein FHX49_000516 [Microbacterium endophyticum]|uniref:PASTA domain-containing protein n=1 Tax=Microbacterium endophyticum TaxID=1526412 RepID=A0A7W4V290_9MICO|nr:Ltp family lipoprotein [Microbacterium endophyticum]MBB2974975.1 hypothetical protein [Microbacterium endophyticum]NIK37272.1 hypothetical protein [Microbacterium endophyticum]
MSDNTSAPAPGWYPAPHANNEQRYWDGSQWTDWTPESAAAARATAQLPASDNSSTAATTVMPRAETPVDAVDATVQAKKPGLRWWAWALIAVGALVLLGIIIGAIGSATSRSTSASDARPVASATEKAAVEEAEPEPEDTRVEVPNVVGKTVAEARAAIESAGLVFVATDGAGDDWTVLTQTPIEPAEPGTEIAVTAEAPEPVYTLEQQNALRAAQSYLDLMAFSRSGLIEQLSSEYGEGYPVETATWAVDTVGADWNAEAAESAQSYLDMMAFSRDGLYEQLTSEYGEGFTPDEANYALSQVGY